MTFGFLERYVIVLVSVIGSYNSTFTIYGEFHQLVGYRRSIAIFVEQFNGYKRQILSVGSNRRAVGFQSDTYRLAYGFDFSGQYFFARFARNSFQSAGSVFIWLYFSLYHS